METSSVDIMSRPSDDTVPPPPSGSKPKITIRKIFNESFSSNNSLEGRVGLSNKGVEKADLAFRKAPSQAWK